MKIDLIVSSILIINITILIAQVNGEEDKKEKVISLQKRINSLSYQGKYGEAIELHKEIIQINPTEMSSYLSLGYLYLKKGMYDEAIDAFEKVIIRTSPSEFLFEARAHYGLGKIYLLTEDYSDAIQEFKVSIKLFNQQYAKEFPAVQKKIESHICSLISEVYKKEGKTKDYKEIFNKSERLKQEVNEYLRRESKINKAKFYYELSNFFSLIKDYNQEFNLMRKTLSLDSSNPHYHFRMAHIYKLKGLVSEAIEEFKQVLKTSPKNSTVSAILSHIELGDLYTIQKRYDEAIQEFELAIKLSQQSEFPLLGNFVESESLSRLAILYKQKGKLTKVDEIDKRIKELKLEKIIKERQIIANRFSLMKDLFQILFRIFIPLIVILTFICVIYIIQRKREGKPIDYPEVKWGIKEIVVIYLNVVILTCVVMLALVTISILFFTVDIKTDTGGDITSVVFNILLISLIIYYLKGRYHQPLSCIGLKKERLTRNVSVGLAGGVGIIFLQMVVKGIILVLVLLVEAFFGGEGNFAKFVEVVIKYFTEEERERWFSQTQPFHLLIFYFLLTTVLGPLAEEMFYRGFVYLALRKIIGIRWAMVLSSLSFCVAHGGEAITPFLCGLVLTYLYERTKSLIPCLVAHSFLNAGASILAYFFPSYFS